MPNQARQPESDGLTQKGLTDLCQRFERGTLAAGEISHRLHMAVIAYLLLTSDEAHAIQRIVAGLRALDRLGLPALLPGKRYNETITSFWITMACRYLTLRVHHTDPARATQAVVERFGDAPDLVYEYYSRNRLHSWDARARWIEPDRRVLPGARDDEARCGP